MPGLGGGGTIDDVRFRTYWQAGKKYFRAGFYNTLPNEHPVLDKILRRKGGLRGTKAVKGFRTVETILARPLEGAMFMDIDGEVPSQTGDVMEQIEYDHKFLIHTFTENRIALAIVNSGDKIFDVLKVKNLAAKQALVEFVINAMYSHGASASEWGGIPYMLSDNPYRTNTKVYELTRGLTSALDNNAPFKRFEFWRNRIARINYPGVVRDFYPTFSAANWETRADWRAAVGTGKLIQYAFPDDVLTPDAKTTVGRKGLYQLMNRIYMGMDSKYRGKIDMIVCNYYLWDLYRNYLEDTKTFIHKDEATLAGGYPSIKFMQKIPLVYDKNCPVDRMYWLDTSKIDLTYLPGFDFAREVWKVPNKWADKYITKFLGNFVCVEPRGMVVVSVNPSAPGDTNDPVEDWDWVTTPALPTWASDSVPMGVNLADKAHMLDPVYNKEYKPAANLYNPTDGRTTDGVQENTGFSGSGVTRRGETSVDPLGPAA
jgi:hypothetical protein